MRPEPLVKLISMRGISQDILGTLVIGGGPAGVGLVLASRKGGLLWRLLAEGLLVVERCDTIGSGDLEDYALRSDSFAASFLKAGAEEAVPDLRHLLDQGAGRQLVDHRGGPVELHIVAAFLTEIANATRAALAEDVFVTETEALAAHRMSDGSWLTQCRHRCGRESEGRSRCLVMAGGAEEALDRPASEPIAGIPLIPRFAGKTVLSSSLLRRNGRVLIDERLGALSRPRVVIVGGSHSAMASALTLLDQSSGIEFEPGAITLLHRSPLKITYASADEAVGDGYHTFTSADICPKTGRVFPLAGFRSDSRQLLRCVWGLGGLRRELRLRMVALETAPWLEVNYLLGEADLIVSALGYRPRALPLFDSRGERIWLASERTSHPLVNDLSQVLDVHQRAVPGVFALGLAAGYPLGGVYGEPSFRGQANGLALWQGEIGEQIAQGLLARITPTMSADTSLRSATS
jgi:hypothetical protein